MNGNFALAIHPGEAAHLVAGWPPDAWLVAFGGGQDRWDAVAERELSDAVGLLPVWPPLEGHPVADIPAEDEQALVLRIVRYPDIAEVARARMSSTPGQVFTDIDADDVDW